MNNHIWKWYDNLYYSILGCYKINGALSYQHNIIECYQKCLHQKQHPFEYFSYKVRSHELFSLFNLNNKNKVHSVINICNIIIWNLSSKIFLCMKTKVNVKIEQHVPDEEKQRLMQLHRRDTQLLSNYDTRSINARVICVLVPTPLLPLPN